MSTYEGELMETNEIDDAESKYFQEMNIIYDDTADQSSGSFQGSLFIPTFNLNSSTVQGNDGYLATGQPRSKEELCTLALQGSRGFQTLDQSALGHSWQTKGSNVDPVIAGYSSDQAITVPLFGSGYPELHSNEGRSTLASINSNEVKESDNFLLINSVTSDVQIGELYTVSSSDPRRLNTTNSLPDHVISNNTESANVQMVSSAVMDISSQETKSPKRRQKKTRSSSHQASELQTQKSDSGRPSVSPNRGEHSSSEGQGASDLGFKPSLLEEILTEKKLALLRSPEVMQFLQSQQEQHVRQKNISHGQHTENP